ncbi:889_t:CDS:10 [Funneliformis geosporum]|uniref:16314_t:CDS:1 n=1 Tax=Funneliformis geosporum TaxID=1117311 RepID=A0A9W4SEW5_9GLOM|nr:16314_t:CDS:10 [Funneliformis geosporum]CAI2179439.1 889_t:CDS:10 [Funneliformis geosporum]
MASPRISSVSTGRESPNPTSFNDPFLFDEQKIAYNAANPEKQELYVFNWLANLERELKKTDKDSLKQCQTNLEKQLLKFISSVAPKPHRPIRQLVARIFVIIYIKGESRTLFDTITALQSLVGAGKNVGEKETKLAALHCIGIILKSLGDRMLSLFPETINICLKTIKNSSNALIVRLEAIYTISKSLEGAGKGATESIIKDIMKQMKSGLGDKALIIKVASVQCMHAVAKYTHQQYPISANELDNLLNQMVKLLDGSNQTIRRSVSSYIATLLAGTQNEVDFLATTTSSSSSKNKSSTTSNNSSSQTSGGGSPTLSSQQDSSSAKVILSVEEMLTHLSTIYNKQSTTKEMRAAIIESYSALFLQLGTKYVELNYSFIAQHLLKDLVSHPRNSSSRYEALNVREHCELLLRDVIGTRLLSEQGQVTAVRELANGWLKQWPALMTNQVEPSKLSLVCAVNEISGLLLDLGGAASTVYDVVVDPLVLLLSHTSYSVQIVTAWCLRCLCYSLPIKLSGLITRVHGLLNKDLNNLANQLSTIDLSKRTIGYAYGLAALLSVIPSRPLNVPFELSAKIFSLSTHLIKTSANKDLAIASIQIQVGWILIGSLMTLGPNFVTLHLPQLLILWKTALPKSTNSKESVSNRTENEWAFMFHVRECVLGAMLSFLLHNSKLVTIDISKRLVALLSNALTFISLVPNSFSNNPTPNSSVTSITPQLPFSTSLKFSDRENMLKRRIFQCFVALRPISVYDNLITQLLKLSVTQFADPEKNVGSAITAAIVAAVSGNFTSVWTTGDEYAYGVTSRLQGMNIDIANLIDDDEEKSDSRKIGVRDWLNRDLVESRVENQLEQPIIGAPEHDPLMIYTTYWIGSIIMDMLQESITHPDPYLRNAASETLGRLLSTVGGNLVTTQMQLLVDQVVNNREPDTRAGSALALGCIYSHVGGMAAGGHLKTLVGILLSLSSDPHPVVHFWALYALSQIIESAGLMFSQYVSSTLGIIAKLYMSDTHEPGGGSVGTTNVGLGFSAYQQFGKIIFGLIGTLGPELQSSTKIRNLCLNLMIELRNDEEEMVVVESIRCLQHFIMFAQQFIDLPRLVAFLQFQLSSKHLPLKEVAVTCLYQLVQKNAKHVFEVSVPGLDNQLFSLLDTDPTIDGVKDIVKSWLNQTAIDNPSIWVELCRKVMSKTGSVASAGAPIEPPSLDISSNDDLDGINNENDLNDDDGEEVVESFDFRERANAVNRELEKNTKLIQDSVQIPPRWRTQLFALQCLHQVVEVISNSGDKDHFDLSIAKKKGANGKDYLVLRVQELIKMAFTASTAVVGEMRLEGLTVLRDVIEKFAATPDPDFVEAALLEQYQAQIGAALTPAFTAESSPEILSAAVKVCAVFVGSGIVKELYRMGRILKLLTTALENCKDNANVTAVGDIKDLSPHAAIMVKLSVLNAWAELQVSSIKQSYLIQVVEPNLSLLCPLWVSALKEYARVQVEPDIAEAQINIIGSGGNGGNVGRSFLSPTQTEVFDSMYSGLTREVILPYYNRSWLTILGAVASLVDSGNPLIINALNGKDLSSTTSDVKDDEQQHDKFTNFGNDLSSFEDFTEFTSTTITSTAKAAKYFFILFGLCVEALSKTFGGGRRSSGLIGSVNSSGDKSNVTSENDKVVKTCINALKAFLRPIISGDIFLERTIFIELISLFDRLVLTEGFEVQHDIIQTITNIINDYGSTFICDDLLTMENKRSTTINVNLENDSTMNNDENKSQTILFYMLRLLVNIFFQKIPSLSARPNSLRIFRPPQGNARGQTSQQINTVLKASLEAFTSLITIIPIKYKNDLIAITFYVFITLIQDPKFQQNDVTQNVLYNIKLLCNGGNLECSFNDDGKDFQNFSKIIHSSIWSILTKMNSLLTSAEREYSDDDVSIIKNNLLASVLFFTCNPKSCLTSKGLQNEFVKIITNGFQSSNTTVAVTSLQCIRTLILLSTNSESDTITAKASTEISYNFIKALIPQLIIFLQNSKLEQSDDKLDIVEEVIKTLLTVNTVANDSHRSLVIAVTLPTLINLLEDAPLESFNQLPKLHLISVKHVLSLAATNPLNFKEALVTLSPQLKSKLENAIRYNVLQEQAVQQRLQIERERKANEQLELSKGPSISLKNDFSGFA